MWIISDLIFGYRRKRRMEEIRQEQLLKRVEAEYAAFQQEMLQKPKQEIFEAAWEISFYKRMLNYFQGEELPTEMTEGLLEQELPISFLFGSYLKTEGISTETFEDIYTLIWLALEHSSQAA